MDNRSKEARSQNMSHIPSTNTKPELQVRKYLFGKGFRYRINRRDLPGNPDIVLPKYKCAVFVNGCFWHAHKGCRWFVKPKTNCDFWEKKFEYNITRDSKNHNELMHMGWKVIVVWECDVKHDFDNIMQKTIDCIINGNNML